MSKLWSHPTLGRIAPATLVCLLLVGCGGGSTGPVNPPAPPPPPPPAAVATVTVTPDTTVLIPGGTRQFAVTLKDAAGNTLQNRTVTWGTSPATVATVSNAGLVTAVLAGTAQLTVQSEGQTGTATVTVRDGGAIGSAGGTVATGDSNTVVTVPAGALAQSTTLTIAPVANPPAHPRLVAGTAVDLGPNGTTFSQAVTVRLRYTAAAIASLDQSRLRLHRFRNNAWEEVPGSTVDSANRRVSGPTTSFSTYAIVGLPPLTVETVVIAPDSADVAFRGTRALTATTLAEGGAVLTGRAVTWNTSDPAIATVSAAGVVTGLLPGTVTITASSEGKQGTARIRVVAADLTRIVDSIRVAFNLPALGAAIVTRTGGTVAIGVGGVRRWGNTTPVTLGDRWHLGSNTKTMTAFLAAMAVKAGQLGWSDLMTARYPELAGIARAEFAPLTLLDLATMRSGITGNPGFTPVGTLAQQRTAVDNWAVQQAPAAPRGTYYYSNIAYQILAEIVGRAWGTGYEQAMRDRLWTPLGVTTGGFGPTTAAFQTDQPIGHFPGGSGWTACEACDNSWATGSGKIHMSLPDWARIIREIMRADAGQSTLLSQNEARALTAGVSPIGGQASYGYGWVTYPGVASRPVTHDGSNNRNRSRSTIYLESGIAYLGTTNAGDPSPDGGVPNEALNALFTRLQQYWQTGQ